MPNKPKLENTVDTSGMWFAAVLLFAVLVAGIIIYRTANDNIRTASNDTLPAPASIARGLQPAGIAAAAFVRDMLGDVGDRAAVLTA